MEENLPTLSLYGRLDSMIGVLLSELRNDLSTDAYNQAKRFVDHAEYGLALEDIAYNLVALDVPWNNELFSQIAEAMGSTSSEYLNGAREARIRDGLDRA